jgi:ADP-ribose pyrophosphatase
VTKEIITTKENVVYENRFVTVFDNDVRFPSGVEGKYIRVRWKAPYGVIVVPVQSGEIIMLEHYRYAEQAMSIELPQGFGNVGSTPLECASRELAEETGLKALSICPLFTTGHDFVNHFFAAEIAPDAIPSFEEAEDTEAISRFHRIRLSDVSLDSMAQMGIFDPVTITGLLAIKSQ